MPRTKRPLDVIAIDDATDAEVDALMPPAARLVSRVYWTPVRVARRAAEIFDGLGVTRVLDVGSGVGKFCVVAGARAPRVAFVGVEHRLHLVTAARALAAAAGVANATFVHGDATHLPDAAFDGFYVFNAFAENGFVADDQLDQTVALSNLRRIVEIMRVERWLATREAGAVILTYHGLGGPIPSTYETVHAEPAGTSWLRAWRKRAGPGEDRYWLDDGDEEVDLVTIDEVVGHLLDHRREWP